jgi:hypothetical protein
MGNTLLFDLLTLQKVYGNRVGPGTLYCADGRVFKQHWREDLQHPYFAGEPQRFTPNPLDQQLLEPGVPFSIVI